MYLCRLSIEYPNACFSPCQIVFKLAYIIVAVTSLYYIQIVVNLVSGTMVNRYIGYKFEAKLCSCETLIIIYIVFTDCFQNLTEDKEDTAATTCTLLQVETQPTQPTCTSTVTATHTILEVSLLPRAQLPLLNSSSAQDATQTSNISLGVVASIVLGVVLVILITICIVAWVVCLKRKKGKLERGRSGR